MATALSNTCFAHYGKLVKNHTIACFEIPSASRNAEAGNPVVLEGNHPFYDMGSQLRAPTATTLARHHIIYIDMYSYEADFIYPSPGCDVDHKKVRFLSKCFLSLLTPPNTTEISTAIQTIPLVRVRPQPSQREKNREQKEDKNAVWGGFFRCHFGPSCATGIPTSSNTSRRHSSSQS